MNMTEFNNMMVWLLSICMGLGGILISIALKSINKKLEILESEKNLK